MRLYFQLVDTGTAETIAHFCMDEALLDPTQNIIDVNTGSLSPIKNGGRFTIRPLEPAKMLPVLDEIKQVFHGMERPTLLGTFGAYEQLRTAVSQLFKSLKFVVINSAADMELLVNPLLRTTEMETVEVNTYESIIKVLQDHDARTASAV